MKSSVVKSYLVLASVALLVVAQNLTDEVEEAVQANDTKQSIWEELVEQGLVSYNFVKQDVPAPKETDSILPVNLTTYRQQAGKLCTEVIADSVEKKSCINLYGFCGFTLLLFQNPAFINPYATCRSKNDSVDASSKKSSTSISKQIVCNQTSKGEPGNVQVINSTLLLEYLQGDPNITSRSTEANCTIVYFFSPYCMFSVQGSAYVNGLARSIPNIPVYGVNSIDNHWINSRFGVLGTPTLMIFHNGNIAARYNASTFNVANLVDFIRYTTKQNLTYINVKLEDFMAVLPSKVEPFTPYGAYVSCSFVLGTTLWIIFTSNYFKRILEVITNTWREAQAHEHPHEN